MLTCPACNGTAPEGSRRCPKCGASIQSALDATATRARNSTTPVSDPAIEPRFIPGTLIESRYRIVGLLGHGGMGEVYRADDLKLGQPVALKFLPAGLESDPGRLERFLQEVRTARRVSHVNVCRVYDVGEIPAADGSAHGQLFISMEYVDGEDLSSLLRRIGRLPGERAVQVARQICAALNAAHQQGILHRDLKPANVMIDGRGQVRLTDFGLAGLAGSIADEDVRSGTPGYMAPEQLSGESVSVRSDIYALGLVLYELFTGQPAFRADSIAELSQLQQSSQPSTPLSRVRDLDPAVEQVVLRCLASDPGERPGSVLAVLAALPGGDPLAEALAAGETPSPEQVAEAGDRQALKPMKAVLLGIFGLAVFLVAARWGGSMTELSYLPLDKRPEVLIDRAQTIIAEVGYGEAVYADPVDQAWGLIRWNSVVEQVEAADASASRWEGLRTRPDAASLWYRQSPDILSPLPTGDGPTMARGAVRITDPLPTSPGEAGVILDMSGRLRRLEVLPKRFSTREAIEPSWDALFELADLDRARFEPTRPRYQRFFTADVRRAWIGSRAELPDVELLVEAGSFEGRPVLFNVASLESMESLAADPERATVIGGSVLLQEWLPPLLFLAMLIIAVQLARRHMSQGSADRRGALRFALFLGCLSTLEYVLNSHVFFTWDWPVEVWPAVVAAAFFGLVSWFMYISAEPIGRRVWPTMFISSSRLLGRARIRWRDPLLGYSVLIGLVFGTLRFLIAGPLRRTIGGWHEGAPRRLLSYNYDMLLGQRSALSEILDIGGLIGLSTLFVVVLVALRLMVKRPWIAATVTVVLWTLTDGNTSLEGVTYGLLAWTISVLVLLRWGVMAMIATNLFSMQCWLSRTTDASAWHAQGAMMSMTFVALLTAYAVWAATAEHRPAPGDFQASTPAPNPPGAASPAPPA